MKLSGMILTVTGGCLISALALGAESGGLRYLFAKPAEHITFDTAEEECVTDHSAGLHCFHAQTLSGETVDAGVFADADITVLYIWSAANAPCVRELPELAEYAAELPDNIRLMTWCTDAEDMNTDQISDYLSECSFSGITLTGGDGDLQLLGNALKTYPSTVFVGSDGTLLIAPVVGTDNLTELISEQLMSILN